MALVGGAAEPLAASAERSCRGTIGARTIDRVRVPPGAYCVLAGTTVVRDVAVARGATLVAGGVEIGGSLHALKAKSVSVIAGSTVDGSVQIESSARAFVTASRVGRGIRLKSNRGSVSVVRASIGGDLQLVANLGRSTVRRNDIGGDLRCTANRPAPTGGDNDVEGAKRGQCARL